MTLTTRILIAMVAGILLGSLLNIVLGAQVLPGALGEVIDTWLVGGLFDVLGLSRWSAVPLHSAITPEWDALRCARWRSTC